MANSTNLSSGQQMDFSDFVDYYAVLESTVDMDGETIKKNYRKLVLDWHPDKRPESPTHAGKKMFQLINDAYDVLRDTSKREEYNATWKEYHKQKLAPFERAELARKEGNDFYKKGQIAARDNNIPAALSMYQQAIERYSEGIDVGTRDHRLHSNRALCYAVLRDWPKAKKDAHEVVSICATFMKGWFTLVRCYIMENNLGEAEKQLESGLKNCDNHPDLQKLQEEISQKKKQYADSMSPSRGVADHNMTVPAQGSYGNYTPQNITPSRTPPTPIRHAIHQGRYNPSFGGNSPVYTGPDLEQTGSFGTTMKTEQRIYGLNDTASFGRSIGYAHTPPRQRSHSPRIPGMRTPPPQHISRSDNSRSPYSGKLNQTIDFGQVNPSANNLNALNQSFAYNNGPPQQYANNNLNQTNSEQVFLSQSYANNSSMYNASARANSRSKETYKNKLNETLNKDISGGPRRAPSLAKQALSASVKHKSPRT